MCPLDNYVSLVLENERPVETYTQQSYIKIPAVYREEAEVACLFHPREPEVAGDQYWADIDAATVVICS